MPSPDPPFLFVYGTLRRGCAAPMAHWLASKAQWHGVARARGWLYGLEDYPGFVPDEEAAWVQGDLFHLPAGSAGEAIIARLDAYEECTADHPLPHEYARIMLPVLSQGNVVDAWTYVYRHATAGLRRIEHGDFLRDALRPPR